MRAADLHGDDSPRVRIGWTIAALALSGVFLAVATPALDTLFWDYDEGWFILAARFIRRGMAPFAEFIHHQPPLHLYLLALYDRLFGSDIAAYRLLSASSIALGGLLVFLLARPCAGGAAALVAQAVFLFTPAQIYALCALPETPTVVFILLGAVLLFTGTSSWTAYASAAAFTAALLVKPTSGVAVLAATLSLLYARDWRRFTQFAVAGIVSGALALAWLLLISDGVFADVLRVQVARARTRSAGMWSVASGFEDMRRLAGAESRLQWAVLCFAEFFRFPWTYLPMALFAISVPGAAIWATRLARSRPGLAAFSVAWPLSYVVLNLLLLDFVAAEKFTPFSSRSRRSGSPRSPASCSGACRRRPRLPSRWS